MRRLLQHILLNPVMWLAHKFESKPNQERVHKALTKLYEHILENPGKKGLILELNPATDKFIVFSDQHKGAKNGSDDFIHAEPNYIDALDYYHQNNFFFISLGDSEELWENTFWPVKKNNEITTAAEIKFLKEKRFIKIFGNHDVFWNNDPFAPIQLYSMYHERLKVYEAVILKTRFNNKELNLFLTHGHQGDGQSDGNAFSAWFVGRVWAPLQSFLHLNPNTPSANTELKTAHNRFMYEWSKEENNPLLITGHTHQPVFASLTQLENLYRKMIDARQRKDEYAVAKLNKELLFRQVDYDFVNTNYKEMKPYYFNTGCCCFSDGDITGIELADGMIRLIKWERKDQSSHRTILEEMPLEDLA